LKSFIDPAVLPVFTTFFFELSRFHTPRQFKSPARFN
jgi:hypothetical protein